MGQRDQLRNKDIFYRMLKGGKMRCRRDWGGVEQFEFTRTELIDMFNNQGGKCYWTGVDLVVDELIRYHPLQPSLDRVDSSKPYSKGNVVISAFFVNLGRGRTPEDLLVDSIKKIALSSTNKYGL